MTAKLDLLMLGIDGVSGLYLLRYLNSYPTFKKLSKEGKLGVHRSNVGVQYTLESNLKFTE